MILRRYDAIPSALVLISPDSSFALVVSLSYDPHAHSAKDRGTGALDAALKS